MAYDFNSRARIAKIVHRLFTCETEHEWFNVMKTMTKEEQAICGAFAYFCDKIEVNRKYKEYLNLGGKNVK